MVTGGYKGRTTALDSEDLATALQRIFVGAHHWGEYGMTELSSQLWSPSLDSPLYPAPLDESHGGRPTHWPGNNWSRSAPIFRSANHQTVLAIETRDEGVVHADGSITLFGRLPESPARGCSLTVEAVDRHFKSKAQLPTDQQSSVRQIAKSHGRPLKIEQVCRALERMVNHPNQNQWTQESQSKMHSGD